MISPYNQNLKLLIIQKQFFILVFQQFERLSLCVFINQKNQTSCLTSLLDDSTKQICKYIIVLLVLLRNRQIIRSNIRSFISQTKNICLAMKPVYKLLENSAYKIRICMKHRVQNIHTYFFMIDANKMRYDTQGYF